MANHLNEVVYQEDIEDQMEYLESVWDVQYNLYERVKHQTAGQLQVQPLLAEMAALSDRFAEIHKRLGEVRVWFPKQKP